MSNELKVTGGEWGFGFPTTGPTSASGMSMMKAVFDDNKSLRRIERKNEVFCAEVVTTRRDVVGVVLGMSQAEADSNARLLAASKKLYEALIVAEEVIFTFEGEKLRDKFPLTLADIRAALAAARGEAQ